MILKGPENVAELARTVGRYARQFAYTNDVGMEWREGCLWAKAIPTMSGD